MESFISFDLCLELPFSFIECSRLLICSETNIWSDNSKYLYSLFLEIFTDKTAGVLVTKLEHIGKSQLILEYGFIAIT